MDAPTLRVLLGRLNAEPQTWQDHPRRVQVGRWSGIPDEIVLQVTEAGLMELSEVDGAEYVELTEAGRVALADLAPGDLCSLPAGTEWNPPWRAAAAMWLWLTLHGGVRSEYSSNGIDRYDRDGSIVHLLTCGLDLSCSGAVRDDSWTSFAGSFVENDREHGISGNASCRCGQVDNLRLLAEVDSVAALLSQVLTFNG